VTPNRLSIRFLSLSILLLSTVASYGAGPAVINLAPSDYRAANKNWAVAEDDRGTLYVGNDRGLLEYDGLRWRLYELPGAPLVRSVVPLSHDTVFTGGFEEFGRWDRDASGVLRYTSLVPAERDERFADSDFWRISLVAEGVLFQSFHEIYLYDYRSVRRLEVEMNMLFLLQAGDAFWVQEMGGSLFRLERGRLEPVPGGDRFASTTVRVLLPGPREGEWIVGTGTEGLWLYDGTRFRAWSPELSARLRRDELNCGIRTVRGTYLFGTLSGGICEADAEGRLLHVLSTDNRLLNDSVMALAEDARGNVWAALDRGLSYLTFFDGIDSYTYNKWTPGSLYDACRWQGRLLLATNRGVFSINESRLAVGAQPSDFRPVAGLSGQIWSFDEIDGRLFVSCNSGLVELRPDFSVVRRSEMGGYGLKRVRADRTYFASYYKLRLLESDGSVAEVDGLDEAVFRIESDYMRNLWLEHPSKGVYRCRMSADGRRIEQRTLYGGGSGDGLSYKLRLFRVGGRVGLLGDDRFYRYDEYADRIEPDSVLDEAFRGVSDIRRVIPCGDEAFWVLSGCGIWHLRYDGMRRAEAVPCAGIPFDNLIYGYEQAVVLDDRTTLFCGDNGFTLADLRDIASPPLSISPVIESLRATDRKGRERWFDRSRKVEIPYEYNSVSFCYTARDGAHPGALFRYRLSGMDDRWSVAGRTGTADFARLPRGRYTFEVAVCDAFGRWSEPCRCDFVVLTPWYATGWAWMGYLVALPLLLYGCWVVVMRFYRRRYLRRVRLQEIVSLRRVNEELRRQIESRDAEIVAQSSMLVGRDEVVLHLRDLVDEYCDRHGGQVLAQLRQKIRSYVGGKLDPENDWTLFLIKFEQKHANYFRIMKERYPDLTTSDLRLSACLKMNLCTKEIASLTNLTVRAVENGRYRLRKKLGLTSAQNLNEFLLHIDAQDSEQKMSE